MSDVPVSDRLARFRVPILAVLLVVIAGIAFVIWRDVDRRLAVDRLCEAVELGDWRRGLEIGPPLVGDDEPGRRAADCLALAHFGAGDPERGVEIVEAAVTASDDWAPRPLLALAAIEERRRAGRGRAAADLARRAATVYPHDGRLAIVEMETRAETEDEARVLDEMADRLERRSTTLLGLRPALALRFAERGEIERARQILGEAPRPLSTPDVANQWFRVRAAVEGMAGDAAAVAEIARRWLAAGGDSAEILAWHGLTLSLHQLSDPNFPVLEMLEQAADRRADLPADLGLQVYRRLIGTLVVAGRHDEALARLDEAEAAWGASDLGVTRGDIQRSAEDRRVAEEPSIARVATGRLRFVLSEALAGEAALWISPDLDEPVDAPWQRIEIVSSSSAAAGEIASIERRVGSAPVRWVLRGADATFASGTIWPSRGRTVEVTIEPWSVVSARGPLATSAPPGDGVRRVRVLLLDCADWRLVQYLRVRGELPALDHLLETGRRAVVWSDPPFTAAAMDALVSPTDRPAVGVFASLQALGSEIGSNPFLGGVDPLSGLRVLVRSEPSLFAVIGAGERRALNLLFSKGKVEAGHHGEVVGPRGATARWDAWREARPLTDAERDAIPGDLVDPWTIWFESTAAVLDAFDTAAESEIDLVLARVAAFDSATHAGFARAVDGGQDDGRHRLYDLYRYVDRRLAASLGRIDADDVLVVMSDHGIRTAMEHDERSFFVVHGPGIEPGRVDGRPDLRGVPRVLAELLGVDTDWPWAGFEASFGGGE